MQDLKIGQAVEFSHVADVGYPSYKVNNRVLFHKEVMQAMPGIICGQTVKRAGVLKSDWGDDYNASILKVTGTHVLWEVRIGMQNKPVLVSDEHIVPLDREIALPLRSRRPRIRC